MNMVSTTHANAVLSAPSAPAALPRSAVKPSSAGYLAAVTPALESALANAHEAGHERAVRILHAVLAILDDPGLR